VVGLVMKCGNAGKMGNVVSSEASSVEQKKAKHRKYIGSVHIVLSEILFSFLFFLR
jgi:hypothetical protein